jgi:SanA protein
MRFIRVLLWLLLVGVVTVFLAFLVADRLIVYAARDRLYDDVDKVPPHKAGLLLGTTSGLSDGRVNPYFTFRIQAAAKLYKAGKIKYIIASGDSSEKYYNEPADMQRSLIAAGVDSMHILLDYAGYRTFDSVIRLRDVFSQDAAIIISQPFHNERALYIARREGIDAIGFNAQDVSRRGGVQVQRRERLARVKVFWDYLVGQEPKHDVGKVFIP